MNKWSKWTNYLIITSVFQKEKSLQGGYCYLSQLHTITLIQIPQFRGKLHFVPNESTLLHPCNQFQTANDNTSVTTKMKINKKKKYYFLMDLKYKNYIHNLWFWYILIIGSISFRIHSIIEKKGAQRVKGWRMCPFTIGECTVKLTPRTSTIVYLRTVIGVIHNNSQEAGRYSCYTESGARLPKIKS